MINVTGTLAKRFRHAQQRVSMWRSTLAGVAICFLLTTPICHAETDEDFFEARVRPLLVRHCLECHGAKKQEGGLRLDSRDAWMRGGDRGAAINAGQPDQSLLIEAVRHDDPELKMPPAKKLTTQEIADLEAWIKRGAFDPRRESAAQTTARMSQEEARTFWSFQPLKAHLAPQDTEDRWSRGSIDAFVFAQLKKRELSPVADADRRTLIRRATFDLTGLPPTPIEIDAFLRDESVNAFNSLVNRLLESKAYGERWGRHWLDVARYADTPVGLFRIGGDFFALHNECPVRSKYSDDDQIHDASRLESG